MANSYTITIAPAAIWSLQDAESYKSNYVGTAQAAIWSEGILSSSIEAISQDPSRYRYNAMLSDVGVGLRERLIIDDDFRCLYDFDEVQGTVEILLFASMKQDLEKMLYRYQIID